MPNSAKAIVTKPSCGRSPLLRYQRPFPWEEWRFELPVARPALLGPCPHPIGTGRRLAAMMACQHAACLTAPKQSLQSQAAEEARCCGTSAHFLGRNGVLNCQLHDLHYLAHAHTQ